MQINKSTKYFNENEECGNVILEMTVVGLNAAK